MMYRCDMKTTSPNAFTLVELLTVIVIIMVLAGLVIYGAAYANRKSALARAQNEIKAMEAACESYKADNGTYPRDSATTDKLDARKSGKPTDYVASRLY